MDATDTNGVPPKALSPRVPHTTEVLVKRPADRSLSPASSSARAREAQSGPTPWLIAVHAMRLRWHWVVLLGIPLSVALAYAAWVTVPTPYTAYAELLCQPRRFFWETKEDDPRFEIYKQTVMRRIKDPNVITAALRDPDVQKLRYVTESPDILERISRELQVTSPAQEFIRLELKGENPRELAAVVNAMIDAFIKVVVDKDKADRKERLEKVERLLKTETDELKLKQADLRKMNEKLEAPTAAQSDLKRQAHIDMQMQVRGEISKLYPQIVELELLLGVENGNETEQPSGDSSEAAGVSVPPEEIEAFLLKDAEYARLARLLSTSRRMRDEWKRRVLEPHREIERLTHVIAEAEQQLGERWEALKPALQESLQRNRPATLLAGPVEGTREQLVERHKMLTALMAQYQKNLNALDNEVKEFSGSLVAREALAEDIESIKKVTEIYAMEAQKRDVELINAPPAIHEYQRARVPTLPDKKMLYLGTLAGAGAGIGLVAGLILLLEFRAQRIFEVSQLRSTTSLPVLGVLPQVPVGLHRARTAKQRLTATYWRDVLFEAFDGVQSMLRHNRRCAEARILMVASSSEGEGKTTATSQLALSFARAGYRVLLIDGDLRRPSLEREFGLTRKPGICEVLKGELPLDEAILHTDLAELDLLPAGQLTDKIRGLLSRDEHAGLLDELSQRYSFVFVDSAPVLLSADTMSLAKHVDGVLMAVRKDVTRLRGLESALHRFDMIGVPVLGLLTIGLGDSTTMYRSDAYASLSLSASDRGSLPSAPADLQTVASV